MFPRRSLTLPLIGLSLLVLAKSGSTLGSTRLNGEEEKHLGDSSTERYGERSMDGFPGLSGSPEKHGLIGSIGPTGPEGLPGPMGQPGFVGIPGTPGRRPRVPDNRGFFFARHSQSEQIPECPKHTYKLWNGFSLSHIMGHLPYAQDLGQPGSCMKKFSTMPFMVCNWYDGCEYAQRNDYSYWLTTTEPIPMLSTPTPAPDLGRHISKCSVCESERRVVALHSQTNKIPKCPRGWHELWVGYSFLMHDDSGAAGGQSLASPGSCLEDFMTKPFITCHSNGTCNHSATATSYWLAAIGDDSKHQQTLKADHTSRVSRCAVCQYHRYDRKYESWGIFKWKFE